MDSQDDNERILQPKIQYDLQKPIRAGLPIGSTKEGILCGLIGHSDSKCSKDPKYMPKDDDDPLKLGP
jgi:hypothetical protein